MHETECLAVPNVGMNLMRMHFTLIYTHASTFNRSQKCVIFCTCIIIDWWPNQGRIYMYVDKLNITNISSPQYKSMIPKNLK